MPVERSKRKTVMAGIEMHPGLKAAATAAALRRSGKLSEYVRALIMRDLDVNEDGSPREGL